MTKETYLEMPHDVITPDYLFDNAFRARFPTRNKCKDTKVIPNYNCVTWFSDGCKDDSLAESGICCLQTQVTKSFLLGS